MPRRAVRTARALLAALSLLQLSESAFACAVCFGGNDNGNVVKAFYLGGAVLLVCVFSLLGALVYAIWRMERSRSEADRRLGLSAGS